MSTSTDQQGTENGPGERVTTEKSDQRSHGQGNPLVAVAFRVLVCLAILAIGAAIVAGLTMTAPTPARIDRAANATPVVAIPPLDERVARRWRGFGTMHPSMMAMVPSRVASTVESVREGLDVGLEVYANEPIVVLDAHDYQRQSESAAERLVQIEAEMDRIDSELAAAGERREIVKREVELAERDLSRVGDAEARGAVQPREVDAAEQKVLTARRGLVMIDELIATLPMRRRVLVAQRDQLHSDRRLAESQVERCTIKAPFDGVVAAVLVEVGEQVAPGAPIVRIFDPTLIELPLRVPASARGRIAVGDRVVVNRTVKGEPIEANVTRIAPEDDAGSRTMTAYIDIDSDEGRVVPGLFVHGEVVESQVVLRSVVPRRSVVNQRLMLVDDGRIRFQRVRILFPLNERRPASGLADTQWLVLEERIPEGMLLVVDGGRAFEEGMEVDPKPPAVANSPETGSVDS